MAVSRCLRLSLILSTVGMILSGLGVAVLSFSYWHYGLVIFGLPGLYFLVAHHLIRWAAKSQKLGVKLSVLVYWLLSGIGFPDNPLLLFVSPFLVLHLLDLLIDFIKWPKA